jgi:uncharacterized damage-inducible protein DinB
MSALPLLRTLFKYQAWANNELLQSIADLDPELHGQERHAATRLINHSYIVDRIFAAHLVRQKHDFSADNTPGTPALKDLRADVIASDEWYLDYLETITTERLSEPLPFVFTDGDRGYMSREEMLTHVVVHGGYHRGEIGRILTQLSITPPWDTFAVYLHQTEPSRRQQTNVSVISSLTEDLALLL